MTSLKLYRATELFLLFVVLPVSFCFKYPIGIKASLALTAFGYLLFLLYRNIERPLKIVGNRPTKAFLKRVAVQFLILIGLTTLFVWWRQPTALFCVPLKNPLLWLSMLGIYSVVSVWPQEIIYRTFFFNRYADLFGSKWLLIFVNAILFSLAHTFFRNTLVSILTFIGGLLFAFTYFKTKSTLLVSLEHALYGNWLFTVGMGEMLAFPGMEAC